MTRPGTQGNPLRVAIVGAGPAGFYSAEHLQRRDDVTVEIDMYDRLPTPYGLVRGGVAPDHQKIKSVVKAYERIAAQPGFRFFGCVELGRDITADELDEHYHVVILCVGASTDRRMDIPGEDLRGSISATDFVAWYNAHPDYTDLEVDLSVADAVVVGNGNVAVDVARILATPPERLAETDIADHALDRLRSSRIRNVTMLGRRGPAQAAFTPKEVRELGEIPGVTLVVDPEDLVTATRDEGRLDEGAHRVLGALSEVAGRSPSPNDRVITLRFLSSPTDLRGDGRVERVGLVRNELVEEDGWMRAQPTTILDEIPAGIVLRAVGYRGRAVAGYPFDTRAGVIPNTDGRIDGRPGSYVAGWIKRGPQGVIGTNRADAGETIAAVFEDLAGGALDESTATSAATVAALVAGRVRHVVSWSDWMTIDAAERAAGQDVGRPRRKFNDVGEMLRLLGS